jgi:biotin synthase-related radical SAM superfamily protein
MYQIECELCNKAWASTNLETILQQFYEHLNKHTREEVEMLRRIAILHIHYPERYQELKDSLTEFEYRARRIKQ